MSQYRSATDRIGDLGPVAAALEALADSHSANDLGRRMRGNAGTAETMRHAFAALGVDLAEYYPHRLRAY